MPASKKKRAAGIQETIGQVLFHDWDPISVNSNENLRDEYDSYIPNVYRILVGRRSEDELVDLLARTEREEMGMSLSEPDHLRTVARKLLAIDLKL